MVNITYRYVLQKAWPIILANAAVPLLGLVDTFVIGHYGGVYDLAALAVASLIFSFIYWSFGFLRMSTTASIAQATGRGDEHAVVLYVVRSSTLAMVIAVGLLLLQYLIFAVATLLISPPETTVQYISEYFYIRIWSAPATLLSYVIAGVFIGRGDSKAILVLQAFLNTANALLDVFFAGVLAWGVAGIAMGTVIAEYSTLFLGVFLLSKRINWYRYIKVIHASDAFKSYKKLLVQNMNIFIRTLLLLVSFVFFTRVGSHFGEITLASNYILLQFMAFSAFFLDGFAHVLESLAGKSVGSSNKSEFMAALKVTSVLALVTAMTLAFSVLVFGEYLVMLVTNKIEIHSEATALIPFLAIYIVFAVFAFQLDGVFIGCDNTESMRNAAIISTLGFFLVWYIFFVPYNNIGLWLSFICYVLFRSMCLLMYFPRLLRTARFCS